MTKQNLFSTLILLAMVSFSFVGSLSHIFTLGLVILLTSQLVTNHKSYNVAGSDIILFILLTGIFHLFFLHSIFSHSVEKTLVSLSPMLSLPIIGLLLVLPKSKEFEIKIPALARCAQISILISLFVYIAFLAFTDLYSSPLAMRAVRVDLLSGNPIPFSIVVTGLSLLSLASWHTCYRRGKILAVLCLTIGLFLALYLAQSRASLLAFCISTPIIFWFIYRSLLPTIILFTIGLLVASLLVYLQISGFMYSEQIDRVIKGVVTLTTGKAVDNSSFVRMELWHASLKTIEANPIFGYGLSERFSALAPYLGEDFNYNFTHPHNDILASTISSGILGGIFSIIALTSPFWVWVMTNRQSSAGFFLGSSLSLIFFVSASFNTIFFNDITAAWLAFSTFLISRVKDT